MSRLTQRIIAASAFNREPPTPPVDPISFVGSSTATGNGRLLFSEITDLQPGDLVVAAINTLDGGETQVDSPGWLSYGVDLGQDLGFVIAFKIMGDPVDTEIKIDDISIGANSTAVAVAFRNAEMRQSAIPEATHQDLTLQSMTATESGAALLVQFVEQADNVDSITPGWTVSGVKFGGGDQDDDTVLIARKLGVEPGPTGSVSVAYEDRSGYVYSYGYLLVSKT